MNWVAKKFEKLSLNEFYEIIKLRTEIFVVEQKCPYQEVDDKDLTAIHIACFDANGKAIAVARVIANNEATTPLSFGRVAVKKKLRGTDLSKDLMNQILNFIETNYPNKAIHISAQCYITSYYEKYGFVQKGDVYLEDDIPHVKMVKS